MPAPHDPPRLFPPAAPDATREHAPGSTGPAPDPQAATPGFTPSPATTPAPASPGRYVLGEEIARGGMGVIHRAADTVLGREVAVKVLQAGAGPHSAVARRFTDEAHIAAQLQHPAIPPIHDLGTLPDGRPFLAMKLIKGETLEELLKGRADAAADRGRFVAVFEQMCQAVAFAHDRRVIHRDLKPANVMVGAFGEVQVMDWGLAKVLGSRPEEQTESDETTAGTVVVSLRDSDDQFTRAGSVLGTPAYMPPEQAAGAVGSIDTRSDVFGLGAVLAAILTGQPPFVAATSESMRVKAAQGDVSECFKRLDASGADPDLVSLCKRCLAPKQDDRPRDAGEVARAVAGLRAAADARARQAEMDRARAEVRSAEERKRRRVQYALAISVLGLLAVAGFGAWWIDGARSQRRAEELQRDTERQTRLVAHERDVRAAFDEFHLRIRAGREQDEDPARWLVSLDSANFALKRAESLLEAGEPNDSFKQALADARETLARDKRNPLVTMEQVCRALNARCAVTFRRRRGASDLPHVGNVIRYHQRRNEQATKSHKKRPHRCVI